MLVQAQRRRAFLQGDLHGILFGEGRNFLTEKDRLPDGTFDPSYGEVVELKEDNYYFKLGAHQQWLIDYIEANPGFHRAGLSPQRSARLSEKQHAGRPVHLASGGAVELGHSDSLRPEFRHLRLVRRAGELHYHSRRAWRSTVLPHRAKSANRSELDLWPADIHVIGKDILKFHAVYWPIMLKAMGLPLPKQILVHGWWQKDGARISKSTGNVVDPIAVINEWGLDAFRFYVLRELDIGPDGNWTDAGFTSRYPAELANGLGNLVNRSLSMLKRYRNGIVPAKSERTRRRRRESRGRNARVARSKTSFRPRCKASGRWSTRANQYVDQTAPFKLAKDPAQAQRLDEVLV